MFIRFIQNQREKQCPFQVALLKISVNHEDFKRVSTPRFGWYGNDRPGISSTILMISVLTIECWPSQSQYIIIKKEAGNRKDHARLFRRVRQIKKKKKTHPIVTGQAGPDSRRPVRSGGRLGPD